MTLADAGPTRSPQLAVVRPMAAADTAFAATLHGNALPHGFFARLGTAFLRCYYTTFVESPHAVAFIAETSQGPNGMLVGTVRNAQHYSWVLRRHGPLLVLLAVRAMVRRPRVLLFFLRTRIGWYLSGVLRFGRRAAMRRLHPRRPRDTERQPAVLTHVAVTPFARGAGAGGALVRSFETAAHRAGCREAVLVTLAGPEGAGRFYRRLGWSQRDTHHDHDGRPVECYERRL